MVMELSWQLFHIRITFTSIAIKARGIKNLRGIFATVAVFALIAADTDSNVSAILANIYIQLLQLYLNIELV